MVGAWDFKARQRQGQIALTVLIAGHYGYTISESQQKGLQTAVTGWTIAKIWGARRAAYAGLGWAAWTPAFWAFVGPQIAGGVIARGAGGEEGLDDYLDFMGDVYALDEEGIEEKLAFTWDVLVHKKHRESHMTRDMEEWASAYFRSARHFAAMESAYYELTPAEQQEIQNRIRAALP